MAWPYMKSTHPIAVPARVLALMPAADTKLAEAKLAKTFSKFDLVSVQRQVVAGTK